MGLHSSLSPEHKMKKVKKEEKRRNGMPNAKEWVSQLVLRTLIRCIQDGKHLKLKIKRHGNQPRKTLFAPRWMSQELMRTQVKISPSLVNSALFKQHATHFGQEKLMV